MMRLRGIGFSYGAEPVLHDVDASFRPGELVGVIGPSGAGKTTLLRILLGELRPTTGGVQPSTREPVAVGYVPQIDGGERNFPLTVDEMVLLGAASFSSPSPWFSVRERKRARHVLKRLEIDDLGPRRLNELSGGQFQRVMIARALMSQPNLLLLDEPTSGIDLNTRRQVLDLIHGFSEEGFTVVLTTHDLNWVAAHLPRVICLNRTIIADGTPDQVLTKHVVKSTYDTDVEVLMHEGRPVVVDSMTGGRP